MNNASNVAVRSSAIARLFARPLPTWRRAAVIATTGEGTITFWNAAAERLYGWRAAEALGRNFLDIIPPTANRAATAQIMAYLQAGVPFAGARRPSRRTGLPIRIYVLAIPVGDLPHGQGAIVTVSTPIAQHRLIWRDAPRIQAEIQRRLTTVPARFAARRPELPRLMAVAAAPAPRLGASSSLGPTFHLAALHRRDAVGRERWRLMQRIETYRLRAERLVSPDRRPRPGEITLARMWLRLAERAAHADPALRLGPAGPAR